MLSSLHNKKNTSILTRAEYARIRKNADPQDVDKAAELERSRMAAMHDKTLAVTETWPNSITNERKARITRLQREAQAREEAQQAIDDNERKHQKAKRKQVLARAEKQAFEEKPEVRSVHAALLVHEVVRERQRQMLLKERKENIAQQKEHEYAQEQKRKYEEAEARERELLRQKRIQRVELGKELKAQRDESEQRKQADRDEARQEEQMLAEEAARLLDEEKLEQVRRTRRLAEHNRAVARANDAMLKQRERQDELERVEEERIKADKYALDDEYEARRAAEKRRRDARQAATNRMIDRQQQTLMEIRAQKDNFDDTQYDLQFAKEQKACEELRAKRDRMAQERHEEYLDAQAKMEAKRRRKKEKQVFPPDEQAVRQEEVQWERECERAKARSDLAEFQCTQATEKKEKEAAERERRKLEFKRHLEDEEQKLYEAQEYAKEMLIQARAQKLRLRRRQTS